MAKHKRNDGGGGAAVMDPQTVTTVTGRTPSEPQPQFIHRETATPQESALVVLSGGQDSTTCVFWARKKFKRVLAITFNYGQRHAAELRAAARVASLAGINSNDHEILELSATRLLPTGQFGPAKILDGTSPLVQHNIKVGQYEGVDALPGGLEATFVPMRNAFFLMLAANRAVVHGCKHIVTGVCQEDFGGYPDCRQTFITQTEKAINEALGLFDDGVAVEDRITIDTPLMDLTKADSVKLARELGDDCWNALAFSHTCYEGKYPPSPHNHASILRAKGFKEAGEADPLIVRCIESGLLPKDYPPHGLVEGTKYALKK